MTWSEAANLAVNQTLMRSINTSVIALLPVAGLLFVGAGLLGVGTLKDLALVLFVGLAAGTYSSIFLATPIVADLKEREPEQIALRRRVLARRSAAVRKAGAAVPAGPVGQRPPGARGGSSVAVAERDLPGQVAADVVVESPSSVRREPGTGGTSTPRPGARPQRPGRPVREAPPVTAARRAAARRADREPRGRRPGLPRAGGALPRPDAGVRRRAGLPARRRRAGRARGVRPAGGRRRRRSGPCRR